MDWSDFLKVMITDERGAIAKYSLALGLSDDPKLKELFQQLLDEEKLHVDILEGHIERLSK